MTTEAPDKTLAAKSRSLKQMLADVNVKGRFEQILGNRAAGFISSIISESNNKKDLAECDPVSVIAAAAIAASLDLPIVGSLGLAALVPYKDKTGKKIAQFQIMVKGWIQLGQRTGQYKHMNAFEVHEGQLVRENSITGEYVFDAAAKKSDKVVGYGFYFQLINGFEKYIYMTVEQCQAHGKKYSKSYGSEFGKWKQDFPAMASKTVVKKGFRWGPVQIDTPLGKAMMFDQAAVTEDGRPDYIDATATPEGGEEKEEKTYSLPEEKSAPAKAEKPAAAAPAPDREIVFEVERFTKTTVDGLPVGLFTGKGGEKVYVGPEALQKKAASFSPGDEISVLVGTIDGRDWAKNLAAVA